MSIRTVNPRIEYKTVMNVEGPLIILDNVKFPKFSEIVNIRLGDGSVRRGEVLEINGKSYKKKTTVLLPASDGWKFSKLFNGNENNSGEKSDRLEVSFMSND